MVDIQSPTDENRRGKKKKKTETTAAKCNGSRYMGIDIVSAGPIAECMIELTVYTPCPEKSIKSNQIKFICDTKLYKSNKRR